MFSIGREVLMKALSGIGKVVHGKINLPILGFVRLRNEGGRTTVSATNLDEHIEYSFDNAQHPDNEDLLIGFAELKQFLKGDSKSGDVVFERVHSDMVKIAAVIGGQKIERLFKTGNSEEWPVWPETPKDFQSVKAEFFEFIHKAFPSASKQDSRRVIMSVCLDDSSVIATNGSELVVFPCEVPEGLKALVPPTKIMADGFFSENARIAVKMTADKDPSPERFHVICGPWNYSVRCNCGSYPSYKQVIPPIEKLTHSATFSMEGLDALCKALPCLEGSKDDPVTVLQAGKNGLHLFSQNFTAPYAIRADGEYKGKGEQFVAVSRAKLLRAFRLEFNRLMFEDEYGPVMAVGNGPGFMVFMPCRTQVPKEKLLEYLKDKYQNKEDKMKRTKQNDEAAGQVPAQSENSVTQTAQPAAAVPSTEPAKEQKQGLTMVGAEADPFEDLVKASEETKMKIRDAFESIAGFQRKIRDAQKAIKAREKSYRSTRELVEKFRAVSNF